MAKDGSDLKGTGLSAPRSPERCARKKSNDFCKASASVMMSAWDVEVRARERNAHAPEARRARTRVFEEIKSVHVKSPSSTDVHLLESIHIDIQGVKPAN